MSTNIYQFNGSLLVSVADGALNTTASPLAIPGKGYTNYGAPVMQDIVWTMQNFAGTTTPTPALQGMCWYDTNTSKLKVYTGSSWTGMFKENQNNIPDTDIAYDLGSGTYRFKTIYAQNINSSNVSGDTTLMHTNATNAPTANNTYDLGSSSYKYANIYAYNINAGNVTGDSTLMRTNATNLPTADNTYNLGGPSNRYNTVYAATIVGNVTVGTNLMRTDATNLPTADNTYNLGSSSYKYANIYSTTFTGTATSAQYADVAERYASDEPLEVGDVVKIGGSAEVTKTTIDSDINVFGVISDKPALKMNDKAGKDDTHPLVALLGRTPVKLVGPVAKGQRVVASDIPGVARAAHGEELDLSIIGRALQPKTSDGVELVEIAIGRN